MSPSSTFIRAMASSVRFSAENQFNFATQAVRQPGSTFKTFVLTEAIREGINPYTTLYASKKLDFVDPHYGPIDVSTYSNSYRGAIPIASATLSSDNSVFQQLTLDVGPRKVIQTAYGMGVSKARKLPDVASIGLGAGGLQFALAGAGPVEFCRQPGMVGVRRYRRAPASLAGQTVLQQGDGPFQPLGGQVQGALAVRVSNHRALLRLSSLTYSPRRGLTGGLRVFWARLVCCPRRPRRAPPPAIKPYP